MARETGEFDWHNDSQGREMLGFEGFFALCFEVAEMWVGSAVDEDGYVSFLGDLDAKLEKAREHQRAVEEARQQGSDAWRRGILGGI